MDNQLSIYDFTQPELPPDVDLESLTEPQIVSMIERATGLPFLFDDFFLDYRCKVNGITYTVHVSKFSIEPFTRFIGCGWATKTSGCGCPCKSLNSAVDFFRSNILKVR